MLSEQRLEGKEVEGFGLRPNSPFFTKWQGDQQNIHQKLQNRSEEVEVSKAERFLTKGNAISEFWNEATV